MQKELNRADYFRITALALLLIVIFVWGISHTFWGSYIYIHNVKIPDDNILHHFGYRLLELLPNMILLLLPFLIIKKLKYAALACLAVAIEILLFYRVTNDLYFFNRSQNPYNNRSFNREIWLSHNDGMETFNPRGLMVQDLVNTYLKAGMKKSDVISVLGKPSLSRDSEKIVSYTLGIYSGIFDNDFLEIKFDENDLLLSAEVIQG